MSNEFKQICLKPGFMKHNGGVLFKTVSKDEYHFKTTIKENHLNAAGITHGGFIAALVDAGAGTAAHRSADGSPCVTISLELKFISTVRLGQELLGNTKIQKKTKSMIFKFFNAVLPLKNTGQSGSSRPADALSCSKIRSRKSKSGFPKTEMKV